MYRFKLYTMFLAINIVIFILSIIINIQSFAGIINFISFVASIIYFLFSWEEPPKVQKLAIPQVHNYYRSRQNTYNNLVSVEFASLSLLFSTLFYSTQLSLSVIVIGLWLISIPVTYLIIFKTTKDSEIDKIIDYIRFVLPNTKLADIKFLVNEFIKIGGIEKEKLLVPSYNAQLVDNVANAYIHYIKEKDGTLVKGEIEEINSL